MPRTPGSVSAAAFAAGTVQRLLASVEFGHALGHRHRAHPGRAGDHLDPAVPQRPSLRAHHQPPLPLVQMRQHRSQFRDQRLLRAHGSSHTMSMTARGSKVNVIF